MNIPTIKQVLIVVAATILGGGMLVLLGVLLPVVVSAVLAVVQAVVRFVQRFVRWRRAIKVWRAQKPKLAEA